MSTDGAAGWRAHLPLGAAAESPDVVAEGSLVRAWARRWREAPDRPVVHDAERGWLSAGDLERASRAVAGRFHRAGLRPGDRVLISATASADLVAAHVGALRLGLVVVPANVAYGHAELGHLLADAGPRAAVVDDEARAAWLREADGDLVVVGPDVALPDLPSVPARADRADRADRAGVSGGSEPAPALDEAGPDDLGIICYTSGTTGAPKGAMLTHGNLLASAEALRRAWRWVPEDRLILCLPLFHVHGLCVGLHGTLLAAASAVLLPGFSPDGVLDAVAEHGATLFFGVPTMYARLAASPRLGELAQLRLCVAGSAPLPAALFERIAEGCGQHVLERYGMTETLMNVSNPYEGERRPGTVGFPLPGVEVRLAEGEEGEILVRGPNVFAGYWRNPAATSASFAEDGWFRSGDLGQLDPDGYLRIVGRSKDLIITGGYNVYPREIEDVLGAHPAVAEVAVAGTPSEEWGETVTAYVVARGERPPADELIAFAGRSLAPYKRPRLVHFVDALPRNALGKVVKAELRAPAGA